LIIPKLPRVYRYFPKLLIANLSFRLSIRCICRNFSENLWEFSETAGKIPKLLPDRSNPDFIIHYTNQMPHPFSLDIFGHCPILSTGKYPIKSKMSSFVQNCQKLFKNIPYCQETSNSCIFTKFLLVLVALGLVSQHVSAAGTPQAVPLYVDVTCGASLCTLPVPWISSFSFSYFVSVTDSIAGHCLVICDKKIMNLICNAKHDWLLKIGS